MRLVSPLLRHVVYPGLATAGYLRRHSGDGQLSVVTYHGVKPVGYRSLDPDLDGSLVSASTLRRQIRLLKSHYNVVAPEDCLQWAGGEAALPERAALLTCDDGLKNTVTEMLPVLVDENVTCLFFITGASACEQSQMLWYEQLYLMMMLSGSRGFELDGLGRWALPDIRADRRTVWWRMVKALSRINGMERPVQLERIREQCGLEEDWWTEYFGNAARRSRFWLLKASEVRELLMNGMSIGAHTLSHPVLPEASEESAREEIGESRRLLSETFGVQPWALAYPFGDPASVTARETQMAREAGFDCAFVNHGGGFGAPLPRYELPRVHVTADMSLGEFEAHVSGFHRNLRRRWAGEETSSVRQA